MCFVVVRPTLHLSEGNKQTHWHCEMAESPQFSLIVNRTDTLYVVEIMMRHEQNSSAL